MAAETGDSATGVVNTTYQVGITLRVQSGSSDTTHKVGCWAPTLADGFDYNIKALIDLVRPGLVVQDELRKGTDG